MNLSDPMLFLSSFADYPENLEEHEISYFLYVVYSERCKKHNLELIDWNLFIEYYILWISTQMQYE